MGWRSRTRKHCSKLIASYHSSTGLWAKMRMTTRLRFIEKGRLGKDDEQPLGEFKTGVFGSEFANSLGSVDSHRGEFTSPLPRALECFVEGVATWSHHRPERSMHALRDRRKPYPVVAVGYHLFSTPFGGQDALKNLIT